MAEPPAGQPAPAGRPDPDEAGTADAVRRVFAEVFPGLDPSDVFPKAVPADTTGLYAGIGDGAADDDVPPWSHPPMWPGGDAPR